MILKTRKKLLHTTLQSSSLLVSASEKETLDLCFHVYADISQVGKVPIEEFMPAFRECAMEAATLDLFISSCLKRAVFSQGNSVDYEIHKHGLRNNTDIFTSVRCLLPILTAFAYSVLGASYTSESEKETLYLCFNEIKGALQKRIKSARRV